MFKNGTFNYLAFYSKEQRLIYALEARGFEINIFDLKCKVV